MYKVLEIQNLNLSIKDKKILENISISIAENQIVGMIGGSGSGKTSLIRAILNIQLPESAFISGKILIKGDLATSTNRKYIQPVFQDPGSFFNPNWDLEKCLEEPLIILFSYSKKEKENKIHSLLNDFSIPEKYLKQSIRRFSGGELQRIAIIRALLCEPEVLLMDEPVSGLDPLIQKDVTRLIRNLCLNKKISIFLISHDIDFISRISDYIYVIENGRIVEENFSVSILENPNHEYTKLLLESRDLSKIK